MTENNKKKFFTCQLLIFKNHVWKRATQHACKTVWGTFHCHFVNTIIIGLFLSKACMKTGVFCSHFFLSFSQTGKIRRSKCSSMSSRLWLLLAPGRRWLAIAPACCRGGEGRERLSGAQRYISGSAGASRRSVCRRRAKLEPDPEPWDIYSRAAEFLKRLRRAIFGRTPYGLFEQQEGKKKSAEMNSVYQHLISLLVVYSSLHVNHLTEGCSCALTHPQDAFCNSDIGE